MELQHLANCRMNVHDDENGGHVCEMLGTRSNVEKAKALVAYTIETIEEERSRQALIGNLSAQLRSLSANDKGGRSAPAQTSRISRSGNMAAPQVQASAFRVQCDRTRTFCAMHVILISCLSP